MSHSVADILWHDLSEVNGLTGQGFIRAQATIYFYDDYQSSHTEADVGAEFAMASATSTDWLTPDWFVPSMDLHEVYLSLGIPDGTVEAIEEGMLLLFSVTHLASDVWKYADPVEEYASPFVQESLFNYFIGGVDDSSQWTAACWPSLIAWLEGGADNRRMCLVEPPTTDPLSAKPHRYHTPRGVAHKLLQRPDFKAAIRTFIQYVSKRRDPHARGTFFSLTRPKHEIMDIIKLTNPQFGERYTLVDATTTASTTTSTTSKATNACTLLPLAPNLLQLTTSGEFANLGESITRGDYDGDGNLEMAIGAPGYTVKPGVEQAGAVFILPIPTSITGQNTIILSHDNSKAFTITGNHRAGRFGASLATVDLNRDGIDDLVVSEPRFRANQMSYRGRISIYYGSPNGLSSFPSTIISLDGDVGNYTMMGYSLESGDLDGDGFADLLVGSPFSCHITEPCDSSDTDSHQRGLLSIFLSSSWRSSQPYMDLSLAPIQIEGDDSYSWFGMSSSVLFNASSTSPLIVSSAPIGDHNGGVVAPGQLLIYDFKSLSLKAGTLPSPLSSISSSASTSKLGWSFSSGSLYAQIASKAPQNLVVSAPSELVPSSNLGLPLYEAGRIYIAPTAILNQSNEIDSHSLLSISGNERFGRFGWSTLITDYDGDGIDDLIVSAPLEARQQGRVYFWRGGSSFPTTSTTTQSRYKCFEMSSPPTSIAKPRIGQVLMALKATSTSTSSSILAITAPRESATTNDAGSIFLLPM